jgi:hypothetical protein
VRTASAAKAKKHPPGRDPVTEDAHWVVLASTDQLERVQHCREKNLTYEPAWCIVKGAFIVKP